MSNKVQLTFAGGAGSVTGAKFLLSLPQLGKKVLIDCGLQQGLPEDEEKNWEPFSYDPAEIDAVIITHAHIDHIGLLPRLVAEGFTGRIYATPPTIDIAQEMLADTAHIIRSEEEQKKRGVDEYYSDAVLRKVSSLWEATEYHREVSLFDDTCSFTFYDAGHILGSAMAKLTYNHTSILFTGDLGNSPSPILKDTETVSGVEYIVTESVYGDRNHETRDIRRQKLKRIIGETQKRKGTLAMSVFSLERTQEFLYELDGLIEEGEVPQLPVYLDSPLAIRLTEIYRNYTEYFNDAAQQQVRAGDDIFSFPGLKVTETREESKKIRYTDDPKIIISAAGMSSGGRILFHERDFLPSPQNTLLLTGYQAVGTLGRSLLNGASSVEIFGEPVAIRARVEAIRGYSAHKDSDGLVSFIDGCSDSLRRVFCVMGEPKSSLFLAQRLRDTLGVQAEVPAEGDTVTLEF